MRFSTLTLTSSYIGNNTHINRDNTQSMAYGNFLTLL
ncbi:hypothetical protein F383_04981 [Gossypium arboreum]|uniref:Uncharacterized protein n=1 Tax=Gossypium arboreum TaxID=29729 RepID=A0A0B0PGZ4_GOSAR|nr:hypothetical protein F383_04981 [Gossypium arboreum]